MKNLIALIALIFASSVSQAGEYRYCEIVGLAIGSDRDLPATIALRIIKRNGLLGTPPCQSEWKGGYEIGKRFRDGSATQQDYEHMAALDAFEAEVADAIISSMGK